MYTSVNKYSTMLYPLWFGGLSYAVVKNYTRPRSVYFRLVWTAVPTMVGLWCSMRQRSRVDDIFMMKNYKHFGEELRDALATGDARY